VVIGVERISTREFAEQGLEESNADLLATGGVLPFDPYLPCFNAARVFKLDIAASSGKV
jgi:2,4-dienoyl-CoA reductase-like NADH-dependent reductase (Old Yellow Enzyme family)